MKYLIAVLALAGIFVSVRALQVHMTSTAPPCAVTETFDCGTVNRGAYSVFPPYTLDDYNSDTGQLQPHGLHVPVAVIGIVGYTLILVMAMLGRVRMVLEMARIAFLCAAFLSYLEAFVIHKWCIYCLWSQMIMTAILLVSIVAVVQRKRRRAQSIVEVLSEHVD